MAATHPFLCAPEVSGMTGIAAHPAPTPARRGFGIVERLSARAVAGAALGLLLLVQFTQVFRRAINWDEFWHYNHLIQFQNGELARPLNTLHVRAFSWVTDLPGNAVDHIVVIRLFMFGCELAIVAGIIALATRFTDRVTGLLCALAYLSFPFVFQHGYSFRFDPPSTALMMGALWVLAVRPLDVRSMLGAGLLIGTALMVTIKIVLLLPAFAGILWWRWSERRFAWDYVVRVAVTGAIALASAGVIFALHSRGIAGVASENAANIVEGSGATMFALEAKPYWPVAIAAAQMAPLVTLLLALFPIALWKWKATRAEKIALVGLYLPLTTLLFYHNTAPYYYVFMLPWVLIACSIAMPFINARITASGTAALFLVFGLIGYAFEEESPIDKQRALIDTAYATFPKDTAYFDFMGMLAERPKANPFVTPATLKQYHLANRSIYRAAMEERPVPLLVDDDYQFQQLFAEPYVPTLTEGGVPHFSPEDAEALRDTYLHWWGPFYLAGEDIPSGSEPYRFEIRVPGTYTVEGGALALDGRTYRPGEIVTIDRGAHVVTGSREKPARIIWGERLHRPSTPPPDKPYFMGW
ncbi:ArnT family glycosyltransferase [Citromicrobium bathyomarinum]|uniref:ArnT family glycosyltransferase n=1 Tax=Citromicrobium bathyomarinum TaxID=72174 RepID=UPI00315A5E38